MLSRVTLHPRFSNEILLLQVRPESQYSTGNFSFAAFVGDRRRHSFHISVIGNNADTILPAAKAGMFFNEFHQSLSQVNPPDGCPGRVLRTPSEVDGYTCGKSVTNYGSNGFAFMHRSKASLISSRLMVCVTNGSSRYHLSSHLQPYPVTGNDLSPAKRGTFPYATSDQLEWTGGIS